jgi:hypothetical protein
MRPKSSLLQVIAWVVPRLGNVTGFPAMFRRKSSRFASKSTAVAACSGGALPFLAGASSNFGKACGSSRRVAP